MITDNGERNPNLGKSTKKDKAAAANTKAQAQGKARTEAEKKRASAAPKQTASSSTSGSLTSVSPETSAEKPSSSSSRSSGTKKKTLSQAEKSAALSDLMNRETIGSSKYGLSFRSSANQQISAAEDKRKKSLVEQATKNGYISKEKLHSQQRAQSGGVGRSGNFSKESSGSGSSGSFERKSGGTGRVGSLSGKSQSATPSVLERVGKAMLGGAIQSGGTSLDAAGAMYQAGQGARDTLYGENLTWYQHQLEREQATLKSMQAENREKPGTYTLKEIQNQQRMIADAQAKVDAFAPAKEAQERSGEEARNLAADVSNRGAKLNEESKKGASKLGQMVLDALSSTAQMGVDAATNAALGTSGSMIPFAFRAFGGGTQQARSEGATLDQQLAFGSTMAAKEIFTEKMFNIAGLQSKAYGKGSVDEYVEKAISGAVDKLAKTETGQRLIGGGLTLLTGATGEGLEEMIGDWMEWQLPRIYKKDPKSAKEVAQDSMYDFLVGALSGTFGSLASPGNILNYQQPESQTQRIVDPTATPTDQAILDALRGVETPENAAPVQETDVDRAILDALQGNKNTPANVTEANQKAELPKVSMEDFANNDSQIWRNVEYGDTDTKTSIMQQVHKEMVERGEVVQIPAETVDEVSQYFPDMRNVSKKERVPVLRQKMNELKGLVRGYLNTLKGVNYEFDVDGNILEAKLYDTGIKEVMEKVTKDKGGMLLTSDQIFKNAQYLYSSPDYDGNSNVQRWNYFYTPIQAGGETLGVRIAVRDMTYSRSGKTDSQIYNWNIKRDAALDGGSQGQNPKSTGVSSAASSNQNVAQSYDSVNSQNQGTENDLGAAPAGFDPLSHASNQYGAIEPGENPTRVVDLPVSMDGETKVGKFARTAAEAKITTDEMVGRIEQLVQDGKLSHEVYSNKQAIEDGAAQIEKKYARGKTIDQIRSEFIRDANAGKAGAKFISQGTTLYADAIAEGNYNAASDILVALTAAETNAGQTVQAARLMKSMTPEGRIFTVQKMVSNLEAQINQKRSANKQIELDIPDTLLDAYQNATTAETQEAALQNIYQNVADQIPATVSEGLQRWRYFSMLANPSTHAKNIIGNVGGTVAKIGKDNIAALAESVIIGDKEGRTKAFLNPLSKADQSLINMGWADYDNAVDLYEDSVGKYSNSAGEINDKRRYWKINDPQNAVTRGIDKALGKLEKVNDFNSKALETEDMLFSKPMYSVALAGYMKANHLTEITDAARSYAMSEAKRATYNDINSVSKWATSLGKGSKLGRFLSGTIYPFKKVPANVMVRTVEYSPLGYLKGMNDIIQMSRGNTDITVAKTIDDFAAATAGTALLGVGAMLAKQGILRATGVGDDKEKEQQKNAFGAKDFSILIGDTYIPIDSFTLSGTGLLTGAQIWEAAQNARNGDTPISFEDFLDALSKITDPVFEQSLLSGMDSILSTIQNSGDAGTGELMTRLCVQVIGNYVGQYVPTVIGRTAASFDQYQRSTYVEPDGAWSPVQSAVQGVQKKLPWLREDMAVSYGNWGVPVKGNGADGFLVGAGKAVTPVYTSQKKTDAVEEEIARLHDENAEYSNFYTRPAKSIAVGGETVKLTSEQYAKYVETRGQTDYNTRADMLESEIYKSLPDNVKSKAMSLSQEYATALGKEAAGVGYENDTAWINDLKGKSQEEITKAILGRAIDAEGGLRTADAKEVYNGTQYAGLSGDVMDASLEYAKQYESALEKEKLGYPIEDGWISEAKELTDKERTDLFIKKATEKLSNSMGGSKYENLGTMLDEGTIDDAAVYASLSKDDVDRYMEVGQGKIGTDKLLDAMSYFNSDECKTEKDANGDTVDGRAQVDNYVDWLNGTGWSDKEKAAAYLQEYTGLKDMPEAWLDAVDEDMIVGAIGKDDLAKWEELGKDTASAQNVLRASYQYDTLTADKDENGKTISGSKQQKYIDWLDSTDMAESEKRTLFLLHYTEKKCPYGTGGDSGGSASSGSGTSSNALGSGTSGIGYASGAASGSGYASNRELTQEEKAYERFGKAAGATERMYQEAKDAYKYFDTDYDMDGNIVRSAEEKFDSWLGQREWTQEQKDAVRAGFYTDSVMNLQWLSRELREGNISVATAKSELSPRMQTGWSRNVLDTGASMAEYIDAFAQFKQAPNADERKAMGYGSKWAWFCDYLNSTDMTAEQKYATAASVQDYADSTLKKIAKVLGYTPSKKEDLPQEETYDLRTDDGYRAYLSLLLGRTKRYEAADGSIWTVSSDGEVLAKRKDGRVLRVRAILGKNGFDDEAGGGYTVSSKAGVLAYKMMQNGVMKTWDAPDGWTWKLSRGEIIAEKNGTKLPVRYAG